MCKVVVNKLMLGARELGYELFDGKQIVEMTAGQIVKALKSGEDIRGLRLGEADALELDQEGFFARNMMLKSHINNFRPLVDDEGIMTNQFYVVVGVRRGKDKEPVFETLTTRFAREVMDGVKLKTLYEMGAVSAGMKLEKGEIVLPECYK